MVLIHLPSFRYSNQFKLLILIDMCVVISLWIAGGNIALKEIDQIIHFHFTNSIFDIILLSSFKALFLFILITELENSCMWIIMHSIKESRRESTATSDSATSNLSSQFQSSELASSTDSTSSNQATSTGDHIFLVNSSSILENDNYNSYSETADTSSNLQYHFQIKKWSKILILIICLFSLIYLITKISTIIAITINKGWPMHEIFLFTLGLEFILTVIQFTYACFCSTFMKSLERKIQQLVKCDKIEEEPEKSLNLKRLFLLFYPEKFCVGIALFMLIVASVTNIAVPFFFGLVVDSALKDETLDNMNCWVFYMFLTFLGGSIAGGIRSALIELASQRVVAGLRRTVFSSIMKQDIQFFDANRTGELTYRISSDSQIFKNNITVNITMMLRYFIQIVSCFGFMFFLEPSMTGLLLFVIPIVVFMDIFYGRILRKLRKQFQDELALNLIVAEEAISSARTVRSFACENKMINDFDKNLNTRGLIGKKLALSIGIFFKLYWFNSCNSNVNNTMVWRKISFR